MAKIKGWEKMKTQSYNISNYFNVNSSDSLSFRKVGDGTYNIQVFNNKYGRDKILRNFKTKKEAFDYAMNYMRTNQNTSLYNK